EEQFCKDNAMQEVWETIKDFGKDIESRLGNIMSQPSPYPIRKKSVLSRLNSKYKNWQKLMTHKLEKWKGVKYIVEEGDIFKR
ncbi:MAG: hypothetical protein IJZ17_02485, partial [Muribaculaceae bacterium]|nr:hypothetical protein [Muribaculaceae bacterium]